MKILIAEDNLTIRLLLRQILWQYGKCDTVVDGKEAIQAFQFALEQNDPYNLICLDIMMPNMDGHETLREIRKIEKLFGVKLIDEVKVIMITALNDPKNVVEAFYQGGADAYIVKPVFKENLINEIRKLGLID
ncbi:MAG: response regulator [Desulfobacterales bacterium]|nr:response regulator [Desulfobacterales bacterium]MBF0395377.1 response regulator [Desulfobacterales bacterium]